MGLYDTDPRRTYYGGSAQAQTQTVEEAQKQLGMAQALGTQTLGQGWAPLAARGTESYEAARPALASALSAAPILGPVNTSGIAASFDPTRATNAASANAANLVARNAMSIARGGPNAALGMRQALQMNAIGGQQVAGQAAQMALQGELQRAGIGLQAAGIANQGIAATNQARIGEAGRVGQMALALQGQGMQAGAQAANAQQQLGTFREQLYSGRDMAVNQSQLQSDQLFEQQRQEAERAKQAQLGAVLGAVGNTVGSIYGMNAGR